MSHTVRAHHGGGYCAIPHRQNLLRSDDGMLRHFVSIRQLRPTGLPKMSRLNRRTHATSRSVVCNQFESVRGEPSPSQRANLIAAATEADGEAAARCASIVFDSRTVSEPQDWLKKLLITNISKVDEHSAIWILLSVQLAGLETATGKLTSARQRLSVCEQAASKMGDWVLSTRVALQQSGLLWRADQRAEAAQTLQEAQVMAKQSADIFQIAVARKELASRVIWDDTDRARKIAEESIELFERAGVPPRAQCHLIIAESHRIIGRWQPAIAANMQVIHTTKTVLPFRFKPWKINSRFVGMSSTHTGNANPSSS